jgi:hypothetical protein
MAAARQIKDASNGNTARVLNTGALLVQQDELVQFGSERILIFNGFLTDDGTQTGSNDMRVNGSVTPQSFFITPPDIEKDLYISSIFFTIADAGATLSKFGNLTALTNGCSLQYNNKEGNILIRDGLTRNFEFGRMCGFNPSFGSGNDAFRANNVIGSSEAYLFKYDFKIMNGFDYGLRLEGGTTQSLSLTINDNITGLDLFDCYVSGFERIKQK